MIELGQYFITIFKAGREGLGDRQPFSLILMSLGGQFKFKWGDGG